MFLPMRTAFVYDMEEHDSNTDVPTTLRRSKEDCPPVSQLRYSLHLHTCFLDQQYFLEPQGLLPMVALTSDLPPKWSEQ